MNLEITLGRLHPTPFPRTSSHPDAPPAQIAAMWGCDTCFTDNPDDLQICNCCDRIPPLPKSKKEVKRFEEVSKYNFSKTYKHEVDVYLKYF